jgi:citrate synthase (EC 2.3.3.1)
MSDDVKRGLEGVLVAETELSCIDGEAGDLSYCGYSIEDLARNASYEEVVYLLWHGELPDAHTLEQFSESMTSAREVASDVRELIKQLAVADEDPMAALRTIVSTLSAYDTDSDDQASEGKTNIEMAKRITAKIPTAIAAFHRFREQKSYIEPRDDLGHAANFLYMLNGHKPNQTLADTFDMALVLHADHGLNASTFSAKVTASTLADLHSAMTAAVGTLSGSLHGGANTNVMRMLIQMDESDKEPREWVKTFWMRVAEFPDLVTEYMM